MTHWNGRWRKGFGGLLLVGGGVFAWLLLGAGGGLTEVERSLVTGSPSKWNLWFVHLGLTAMAGLSLGAGCRLLLGRTYRESLQIILSENAIDRVENFTPPPSVRIAAGAKSLAVGAGVMLVGLLIGAGVGTVALRLFGREELFWVIFNPVWTFGWACTGFAAQGAVLDGLVNIVGMGSGRVVAHLGTEFDLRDVRAWRVSGLPRQVVARGYQIVGAGPFQLVMFALGEWVNRWGLRVSAALANHIQTKGVEVFVELHNRRQRKAFLRFATVEQAMEFDQFLQGCIGGKK